MTICACSLWDEELDLERRWEEAPLLDTTKAEEGGTFTSVAINAISKYLKYAMIGSVMSCKTIAKIQIVGGRIGLRWWKRSDAAGGMILCDVW